MSKKNYTHIISLIDCSGSMSSIKTDMEGGFDVFIKKQQEVEGEATSTLIQFDDAYEVLHENIAIKQVPKFNLVPRGMTALLDAIGKTLENERKRIKAMDESEQPEKVVCIIITDGHENASRTYNRERIFTMISDLEGQEDPQWDFIFLGANQDAIKESANLGIRAGSTMTYDTSSIGTQSLFHSLSENMTTYRCCSTKSKYSFSEEDKAIQEDLLSKK